MKSRQNQNLGIVEAVKLVVKYGYDDSGWWMYVRLPFGWNPRNPDAA